MRYRILKKSDTSIQKWNYMCTYFQKYLENSLAYIMVTTHLHTWHFNNILIFSFKQLPDYCLETFSKSHIAKTYITMNLIHENCYFSPSSKLILILKAKLILYFSRYSTHAHFLQFKLIENIRENDKSTSWKMLSRLKKKFRIGQTS